MSRTIKCRYCDKTLEISDYDKPSQSIWAREDVYGIFTCICCDDCYDSPKYGYKKDKYYDYLEAGEYLEAEDY